MILGAHVSTSGGVFNAPFNARELGVTAIQIFTKNQNRWQEKPLDPKVVEKYRTTLEECGIVSVVAHDAYLINLCATNPTNLEKSRAAFLDEMERADQLGIPYLVTHPGSHLKAGEEAGLRLIADSLNRLFDKQKSGKVRVLLETTAGQGTNLGYRFEQIAQLMDWLENKARIGVCLDTCHIFAAGYDFRTAETYRTTIAEFDRVIGLKNLHACHLNDSKRELGSRIDRHEHIGQGQIGAEPFRFFLEDPRLAHLPALLETPGEQKDYARDLAVLRGLLTMKPSPKSRGKKK